MIALRDRNWWEISSIPIYCFLVLVIGFCNGWYRVVEKRKKYGE
jgi:hypothetical protein